MTCLFSTGIVAHAETLGIESVVTSMCQEYGKTKRNMAKSGFELVTMTAEQRLEVIDHVLKIAAKYNITLKSCADSGINDRRIIPSRCVDGRIIGKAIGEKLSVAKDSGQRTGCGCTKSRDIGNYTDACNHGCRYCYANPTVTIV